MIHVVSNAACRYRNIYTLFMENIKIIAANPLQKFKLCLLQKLDRSCLHEVIPIPLLISSDPLCGYFLEPHYRIRIAIIITIIINKANRKEDLVNFIVSAKFS